MLRGLAAAVAAIGAIACASEDEKFQRHLQRGDDYASEQNWSAALIEYKNALQLRPTHAEVNERIALASESERLVADAIFHYQEAWRLDRSRSAAALEAARLLLAYEPERAEELARAVLDRDAGSARAHVRLSEAAVVRGDPEAADLHAEQARQLDSGDALVWRQWAVVQRARIGRARQAGLEVDPAWYEGARSALERASELSPGDWALHLERAQLLAGWPERQAEASAAFRQAWEVAGPDPSTAAIPNAAARHARRQGDLELLRWSQEQLIAVEPRNLQAWQSLASAEQALGGSGEAVLRRLVELHPDRFDPQLLLVRELERQGRLDEAAAMLDEAAGRPESPAAALSVLANLELARGDRNAAEQIAERLQREHPEDPRTAGVLARLELADGRAREAVRRLGPVVERAPSAELLTLHARALLEAGDAAAAREALDGARREASAETPAMARLDARLAGIEGRWTRVVESTERLLRTGAPLLQTGRLQLARAYYELGRVGRARRTLRPLLAEGAAPAEAALLYARFEWSRDPERAEALLRRSLELEARHVGLHAALNGVELARLEATRALARLDAVLEAPGAPPGLRLLRGRVLIELGRLVDAEAEARRALEEGADPGASLQLLISVLESRRKGPDEAIALLEGLSRGDEKRWRPLRALLLMRVGRPDEAQAIYEEILAERDPDPAVQNNLAHLLAAAGLELERALGLAQRAVGAEGWNPDFVDTLGFVLQRLGEPARAAERFRTAIGLADFRGEPKGIYHFHLGDALGSQGLADEAAEAYRAGLAIDPEGSDAETARRALEALEPGSRAGG